MPHGDDGGVLDRLRSTTAGDIKESLAGTISKGKEKLSEKRRERKRSKQQTQARRKRALREARREARKEAEKEFREAEIERLKEKERTRIERADRGILGTIGAGLGLTGEASEGDDDSFLGFAPPEEPFFSGEGMGVGSDEPFLAGGGMEDEGFVIEAPEDEFTLEMDDGFRI